MKQQSPACCVCVAPANIWQPAEASRQGSLKSRVPGVWFITPAHELDLTETEHPRTHTSNKAAFLVMSEKISRKTQAENKGPEETVLNVLMCRNSLAPHPSFSPFFLGSQIHPKVPNVFFYVSRSCYMTSTGGLQRSRGGLQDAVCFDHLYLGSSSVCVKNWSAGQKSPRWQHRAMFEGSVKRICNPVACCSVAAPSHTQ